MNSRTKRLSEIEGYEDINGYAINVDGELWSLKYKIPKLRKPVWSGTGECRYLTFRVRDDYGSPKTLYLHKLVALAFLPCDDPSRRVVHKNKDRSDNRLENLEWVANIKEKQEALDFILQRSLVERILQVHVAAQMKGLKVSDSYSFTTEMVENAIEGYIKQYGLRKVMPAL
jgi:hypothetical protein